MHAFAALLGAALAAIGLVWLVAEGVEALLSWRHERSKVVKFRPKTPLRPGQLLPERTEADIVDLGQRLRSGRLRRLGIHIEDDDTPAA